MSYLARFFNAISSGSERPRPLASATRVRAFQIIYDGKTRERRDPAFEPLDNSSSERPDWFEYWPIRKFLNSNALEESTFYGFLSPQFYEKTRLSGAQVLRFVEASGEADVVTFSPFPCHGATFLNVFEQEDFFHPGFLDSASAFLNSDLRGLINHSGNTVFCNYFFAKPRFWRAWSEIGDRLFNATESRMQTVTALNEDVRYVKENGVSSLVARKVFMMERIAPYLLASSNDYSTSAYPSTRMPVSQTHNRLRNEIVLLDELKKRFAASRQTNVLEEYRREQERVISMAWPGHRLRSPAGQSS